MLCIVMLDNVGRARRYIEAGAFEPAQKLWSDELRPEDIDNYLADIENRLGLGDDTVQEMKAWRKSAAEYESQTIHPSYAFAVFTGLPPVCSPPDSHAVGIFGAASLTSFRTLDEAVKAIWYFASISSYQLFAWRKTPIAHILRRHCQDRAWWNKVFIGRAVLKDIVIRHWENTEGPQPSS